MTVSNKRLRQVYAEHLAAKTIRPKTESGLRRRIARLLVERDAAIARGDDEAAHRRRLQNVLQILVGPAGAGSR